MNGAETTKLLERCWPRLRFEFVKRADCSVVLPELYKFSNYIVEEEFTHWKKHVDIQDFGLLIRHSTTNEIFGFQFFRSIPTTCDLTRVLFGGKLRLSDEVKNRSLHISFNLLAHNYYQQSFPNVNFYRVGLVNIFAFVSFRRCIHDLFVYPFDSHLDMKRLVCPIVNSFNEENGFTWDDDWPNIVNVGQETSEEVIGKYSASFWEKPEVGEFVSYVGKEKMWKRDIFIGWEMGKTIQGKNNIGSMKRSIERKIQTSI